MNPTLGQLGPITLRTYTLLLDLALLVGLGALAWHGWRAEGSPTRWLDGGLSALLVGLVAGRMGHVAIHWNYFTHHHDEIAEFWNGGLDWHAALAGGLLGLALYSFARGLSFRHLTDLVALPLALGTALAWTGCMMAGCAYGAEVRSLADYPAPIVAEWPDLYGIVAPRFTSQLYGIALGVVLTLVSLLLWLTVRREGARLWGVLALMSLGTFAIGFARGDAVPAVYGLRLDQVLDLIVAALSLMGLIWSAVAPFPLSDEERAAETLLLDEGTSDAT